MKLATCLILFTGFFFNTYAQNLNIKNNSFQKGVDDWLLITRSKNSKKPVIAQVRPEREGQDKSPACKISVVSTDPDKKITLVSLEHKLPPLKKNKNYEISFYAKSNVLDDLIALKFCAEDKNKPKGKKSKKVTSKFTSIPFKGDGTWQKLTYKFKAVSNKNLPMDLNNCCIQVLKGDRSGVTYLDNFSIKQI